MLQSKDYTIPKGSIVLVTAANGYIANHVVGLFLNLGYRVRGTVRSDKPWLNSFFEEKYDKDKFETVIVANLPADNALDEAIRGVSAVVQVVNKTSRVKCPLTNDKI
jgi:uncharacterized protein YbjT (DUF2867 family)